VTTATARSSLLELLRRHSYQYDPEGRFELTSGKQSRFYVDCKRTTMRGDAAEPIGALVAEHLPRGVTAVGGLTLGADPIAQATASYCTRHGRPVDAFAVRKDAKRHGLRRWIEGCAEPGATVAVVDDVVTTGGSTIQAIERCRQEGLQVAAVVVLVDRQEEEGIARIREVAGAGVPVTAIFTIDDVRVAAERR